MNTIVAALISLTLPIVAGAHHSRAEFANDVLEIEGEIVEVGWNNPHPVLTVKTAGEAGQEKLWKVESWQSANSLDRRGVPGGALFQVGDRITVAGRQSMRRTTFFLGINVRLADGREVILRTGGEPHFGGPVVGNAESSSNGNRVAGRGEPRGIFRTWSYESREVAPQELPLTEAAVEKASSFDELQDHPQWYCQPEGMPLVMDSAYPIEFVDEGDIVSLRLERTDATRTIHLNAGAGADSQAPGPMGYSVGRWEEDTLVVTTGNIDYPYFDDDGTPQSELLEIFEQFALNEDRSRLEWTATVTDPATFTEPVTILTSWRWVPGEEIRPWNCAVFE